MRPELAMPKARAAPERPHEKGSVTKIAFGPKTIWTDTPANTQEAIKELKN
jgi:hypothetical protein